MDEMTIQQAFELALQHHQAGRLNEAESIYRQILAVEPRHADALNNLGALAGQAGYYEMAVEMIRQAIALAPGVPGFYTNLCEACRAAGQLDEAIAACHQLVALKPDHAETHFNLGNILMDKGQVQEAIAAYLRAINLKPDLAEAHSNLGAALYEKGCLDDAIATYRRATVLKPDFAMAYNNLGNALRERGEIDESVTACRQAIAITPDFAEAHNNLGNALRDQEHVEEAIACYRQAIALKADYTLAYRNLGNALREAGQPHEAIAACRRAIALNRDVSESHFNLGNALKDMGSFVEAIAAYRQAISLNPRYPEALSNLGVSLSESGRLDEAITTLRQAIAMKPQLFEAHNNLATALNNSGQLDEAFTAYRQALALRPNYPAAHSNLVYCMNYHPGLEAAAIAEEHRCWDRIHAEPLRQFIRPHANDRNTERRLRVGYVSPDFRNHSVAYFIEGVFEHHDRAKVELFCYAEVANSDAVTDRLENLATHWRSIICLTDMEVAEMIRKDSIDILVDLAGHTANNRLPVFARKPAPVQVTWLGYSNKTWLDTIDYRLTDAFADPLESSDGLPGEQLVRLPKTFACFRPVESAPPLNPQPAAERGWVTFASFHMLAKLNESLLEYWAEILNKVSGSRMMLVASGLDEPSTRKRFTTFFGSRGIDAERLEFKGRQTLAGYLALHHEVDILLDSHPFSGHTVSCHALWMGVPVVTLAGKTHCSRMVASVMSNLDLAELIAHNPEQYIQLAVELANDLPRLAALRSTLREKMQASPLMDAAGFARDIEAAYRNMWRTWCEQPESPPCPK